MLQFRSFLFMIAIVASCSAHAGDWPTWRHDAQRTAATPEQLPEQLHLNWVRYLPPPSPAWPASQAKLQFDAGYEPVVAGSLLFVGSCTNDSITAYDTRSGDQAWRFYTDGPVRFAPAVWQDRVLATSDDGYLYCLQADNGELLWRVNGGPSQRPILGNGRLVSTWPARGGVVVEDGIAYFAAGIWPSMGVFVHAVDVETSEILWTNSETSGLFLTHPHGADAFGSISPQGHLALAGDLLIVPGGRTMPALFDRHTGEFRDFNFGGKGSGGHEVISAGGFYFCGGAAVRSADSEALGQFPARVVADGWVLGNRSPQQLALTSIEWKTEEQSDADRRGEEQAETVLVPAQQFNATIEGPGRILAQAGNQLITAGNGMIATVDSQALRDSDGAVSPTWSRDVAAEVWTALVADERLFVVTEDARLLCFGLGPLAAIPMYTLPPDNDRPVVADEFIDDLVAFAGTDAGQAIVLGLEEDGLIEQLIRQTSFEVIGVDADSDRVDSARRSLDEMGLYGTRATLVAADPFDYPFPPCLASLIVATQSRAWTDDEARRLFETLRPYGGAAVVKADAEQHLHLSLSLAESDNAELERHGEWTIIRRVGPLPGSGEWTHQYGDASQSGMSRDTLVKAPFGVLWFGGPSNDRVLPRHGHGPAPQVAGGRLFIEGPDMLRCVDVYTGRVWWERDLPGLGTFYNNTGHHPGAGEIGSNYVSLPDHVYVIYGEHIHELDAETGSTARTFSAPEGGSANWGALAVDGDVLIAAASPVSIEGSSAKEKAGVPPDARAVIEPHSDWRYMAGSDPADNWTEVEFDSNSWDTGAAGFGYGDRDDETELEDMEDNFSRVYIRQSFDAELVGESQTMTLEINFDDAFIAYLNGHEILRQNVGQGRGADAEELDSHEADGYEAFQIEGIQELLQPGHNVLAVEGHNDGIGSSDFSLDPYLYINEERRPTRFEEQVQTADYASSSRRLVVFDRHTGNELWSRDADYSFRHNSICAAVGMVFCIDGLSPLQLAHLQRRGIDLTTRPRLLALDARTGNVVWSTEEAVFGTFLSYSDEHDVLLQAGSAFRDRADDEVGLGMVAYHGPTGDVLWQQFDRSYNGPCLLWKDRIITNGTGGYELDLLTGEPTGWEYIRMYGCNTAIGSEHLLTFRSGAAGFCDLEGGSGTGNLGGFRSSCTSNLIVADGVLNAPDYTRTCVCAYQLQTSLAFVHMPDAETWTFNRPDAVDDWSDGLAINFAAPGDRADDEGQVWFEYPTVGGPSPDIRVNTEPAQPQRFLRHSALLPDGELRWVAASGLTGIRELSINLGDEPEPRSYTVSLVFSEPDGLPAGQRVFSVSLQGQEVLTAFDSAAETATGSIIKQIPNVSIAERLVVTLSRAGGSEAEPVLCGIRLVPEVDAR